MTRKRDEGGYIGVTAMGIMLLLLGTSIILMGAVRDQVVSARNSQEFTSARQGISDGTAAAVTAFNDGSFDPRTAKNGAGSGLKGTYSWFYDVASRTVTSTGAFRDIDQADTLPLRWLNVGSKATSDTGSVIYGLAANGQSRSSTASWTENAGAWAYGLTTGAVARVGHEEGDAQPSLVRGTFGTRNTSGATVSQFDYALLGDTTRIEVSPGGVARPRVMYYADAKSAVIEGDATGYRSHLNLQFDHELLSDRTTGDQFRDCKIAFPPAAGAAWPGYKYCAGPLSNVADLPAVQSTSGVVTIVVKGSVIIGEDFNVGQNGQVHLYATGDVIFAKPSSAGAQVLNNLFVFAPEGTCRTEDANLAAAQSVVVRGALACRTVTLPNASNSFTHVMPLPDTDAHAGASDKVVYYTESAGHLDTRTPGLLTAGVAVVAPTSG